MKRTWSDSMTLDQITYRVDGMSCEHCRVAVTSEVSQVAGVRAVDVDLDTKLVRVEGTGVDAAEVVAAIDEAGYDAVPA
jgi:copper chaperone